MMIKKTKTANTTITRNMQDFSNQDSNMYETVAMLIKRSNQISIQMKQELHKKIEDFASINDGLEEIYENREQIEIVKYYEQLPKPTLIATQEYIDNELYYRNLNKDRDDEMSEEKDLGV